LICLSATNFDQRDFVLWQFTIEFLFQIADSLFFLRATRSHFVL